MSNCDDDSDDYYDDFKRGRKCFFSIHVIFNHKELQVVSTNKCISSKFLFLGHLESKLWQCHWNIYSNFSKLTFKCKTVPLTHELITLTAKAPLSDADVPNQSLTSYCLPLLCQITSKQEHADTMVMMKRASTRTNSVKKVRELFLNPWFKGATGRPWKMLCDIRGEREGYFGFWEREWELKITFPFYGKGTGIRKCYGKGNLRLVIPGII